MLELLLLVGLVFGTLDLTPREVASARRAFADRAVARLHPIPPRLLARPYRAPVLEPWFLPYEDWEAEYAEYFQRHAHDPRVRFRPSALCMHYTVTGSAEGVWQGFAAGGGMWDGKKVVRGHISVQLLVDTDGTVYQLMPLDWRCTGGYGVNHVALSIEMVARNERDLLSRPEQVYRSFCLVQWLMQRYNIPVERVWAHSEVGLGKGVVPDYRDYADPLWPHAYPPEAQRKDPGEIYMAWLRAWLRKHR